MDMSATHLAVSNMLKSFGSSCKIDTANGDGATTTGVLLSGQTSGNSPSANGFVTKVEKTCYVSGKIGVTPKPGDTVTFKPNIYVIKQVKAIALGDGSKNVFAYKLTVST